MTVRKNEPNPPPINTPPDLGNNLLVSLGKIAGIGGIALGIFFLLFRKVLEQNFISRLQLQPQQGYNLLLLVVLLTFGVAIAGLAVWAEQQPKGRRISIFLLLFALVLAFLGSRMIVADSKEPTTEGAALTISGTVFDEVTGFTIKGATIKLDNQKETTTDDNGNFLLELKAKRRSVSLQAEKPGYGPSIQLVTPPASGVPFQLKPR